MALDNEIGIGYATTSSIGEVDTPMLEDLKLKTKEKGVASTIQNDWWQRFLLGKYTNVLTRKGCEIRLTNDDLILIKQNFKLTSCVSLASSFYLFGNILAASFEALDQGDFVFNLLACKGPSSVNMLSRFAGGSEELEKHLKACTKIEELHHPEIIFAEIVHFPENRSGNIMTRPNLYKYEMPYLGQSTLSGEFR